MKNLRLNQDSGGNKFLNTPKSDLFSYEETDDFTEAVVEDVQTLSTLEVSVTVLGVESISTYYSCTKCGRKATLKHGSLLQCQSCHMLQKVASSTKQWFLRVLFENLQKRGDVISLSIYSAWPEIRDNMADERISD